MSELDTHQPLHTLAIFAFRSALRKYLRPRALLRFRKRLVPLQMIEQITARFALAVRKFLTAESTFAGSIAADALRNDVIVAVSWRDCSFAISATTAMCLIAEGSLLRERRKRRLLKSVSSRRISENSV